MSGHQDGGPAFPREDYQADNAPGQRGMSLRDYFAAKALPIAMQTMKEDFDKDLGGEWAWNAIEREMLAEVAYELADAMLKARTE